MKKLIPLTLSTLLLSFLVWYYPIQRYLALKDFEKYITMQGTNKHNIKEQRVHKDYIQDGYFIDIIYKDDQELRYQYKWYIKPKNSSHIFDILLIIYKGNKSITSSEITPKYPPLHSYT